MAATNLTTTINELIHQESLLETYADTVNQTILPLAQSLHPLQEHKLAERIRRAPKQGDHGASSAQQQRIMSDDGYE